jgi:pimeloyl-ACP methyl ester carboxylesterase
MIVSPVYHPLYIDVNNISLAYVEAGDPLKPTVLFIHGLGENSNTWLKNIAGLHNDFHCIAIDLPAHGLSQKGDYLYTPYFFAEILASFLKLKGLEQVTIAGHSLGGQIGIILAISNAALVNKLILISPAGFEIFTEVERRWLINHAKSYMNPMEGFSSFPLFGDFQKNMPSNDVYKASVAGMLDQPVFDHLVQIRQPVLIIFGAEDPFIPNRFLHPLLTTVSVAETGAKKITGSKLFVIPNGGHFVHFERMAEVNEIFRDFMLNKS